MVSALFYMMCYVVRYKYTYSSGCSASGALPAGGVNASVVGDIWGWGIVSCPRFRQQQHVFGMAAHAIQ
jgi:hypothetical protein